MHRRPHPTPLASFVYLDALLIDRLREVCHIHLSVECKRGSTLYKTLDLSTAAQQQSSKAFQTRASSGPVLGLPRTSWVWLLIAAGCISDAVQNILQESLRLIVFQAMLNKMF